MDEIATHDTDQVIAKGIAISGAAVNPSEHVQQKDVESCSICLRPVTNRAIISPCNHWTFDFECLVSWLQQKQNPKCPLCKATVERVEHDWQDVDDYQIYCPPHRSVTVRSPLREGFILTPELRSQPAYQEYAVPRRTSHGTPMSSGQLSLARRRHVYAHRLFSLRVGANNISRYRDFTAKDFAASPDLQRRARAFLTRELQVFCFLEMAPRGGTRNAVTELIISLARLHDLKGADGRAEEIVAESLGPMNAKLLLHELEAWLRSPFRRLEDWDRHVQYLEIGQSSKRLAE